MVKKKLLNRMVIFSKLLTGTCQDFRTQADPTIARETVCEIIHILIKIDLSRRFKAK